MDAAIARRAISDTKPPKYKVQDLVACNQGLGHIIEVSQRYLRIDALFVGILTFGIIGVVTDRLLEFASRKLFRWHYITLKR